jgi:hypothetical protein
VNQSSSEENQQTIYDVGQKIDAQEQRDPRAPFDWRWWAGLSVTLLILSVFAATLIFGVLIRGGQNNDARDRQKNEEIETCARRYATRVTNAQVDNDVALNNLVVYLGNSTRDEIVAAALISDLESSTAFLERARDARLEYEQSLILPCPIEPLVPND